MDSETEALLWNYSREIFKSLDTPMSLQDLIASHRSLRNQNMRTMEEHREMVEQVRKDVERREMNDMWIKWDDVKKMSLLEIANRLSDPSY